MGEKIRMTKRNATVDFLKCYAALLVFICHTYIICKGVFDFEFTQDWQFLLKMPAWAGVWIFMMVSGFLAGTGFFSGKYSLRPEDIGRYFKDRFLKVVAPTWVMISIVYILADPQIPSVSIVFRFITCMFRGGRAANGVGATWYVFCIAWLYLLTPVFVLISKKLEDRFSGKEKKYYIILLCLLASLGLVYRVGGRIMGLEWYRWIYASPIGNIDLFWGGLIISRIRYLSNGKQSKPFRLGAEILLLAVTVFCAYCYFYGETIKPILLSVYRYLMPTVFLIVTGGVLFNSKESTGQNKWEIVLHAGATYTFQYYLWHSLILNNIATALSLRGFSGYLICMLLGAVLTVYISYLMTEMQRAIFKA